MANVAIATDSNSGITQAAARELGIRVLPMPFYINEELFFEDITLTQEEFYRRLAEDADISTSQPAPGDVTELWDRALEECDQVVYIPMSSGLSASCETAMMLSADYKDRVFVVDNQRISITQRQSVLDALAMVRAGLSAREIHDVLMRERLEAIALPRRKGAVSMVLSGLLAVLVCGCALISGAQSSVPDLPHTPNFPPVSLVFREFLQGERTVLYSKEHAYNQRATIQQVPALFSPDSEYAAVWRFAVVDLNRDGEEEMILQVIDAAGDLGGYLILHRQGGELYGFFHRNWAFEELKTDGTFFFSSINGRSWAISGPMDIHVEDTGRGYSIPVVASQEQHPETGAEIFYVGGYRVSKETYNQVLENQRQKEDVPWYDFTLEGIAQAFPEEDPFTLPEGTENLGAIAAALEADFVDYWNTFVSGSMVLPKVTVLQSDRFAGMDRAVFLVYPDYNNTHTVAYSVTGDTVRRLGAFPSGLEFAFSAEKGGLLRTTWTQESPGGGAERFYYYYRPLPEGGVEWTEVLKAWADSEGVIQSAAGWQTEDQSLTKPLTPAEFEARLAAADEDFREAETISFGTVKNLAESGFDLSAPLGEESQPGSWRDFLARAMFSSGSQAAAPPPALTAVLMAGPGLLIVGVLLALFQRVKEIGKGEIDDAKQY